MSFVRSLECPKCQANYSASEVHNLCQCGAPLLVRYDLEKLGKAIKKEDLMGRRADLWRYREFLPLEQEENLISLGEGFTPNFCTANLGSELGFRHLYIKDEGFNPTGTFKARGAAVGISKAKEQAFSPLPYPLRVMLEVPGRPTAVSESIHIAMPVDAPDLAKRMYYLQAQTYLVKGLISDAGKH